MAVLSRILAAAAIVSVTFADIAGASAAEHYGVAAQRARANAHARHDRAAHVNAAGGENRKRSVQKRCKAASSVLTSSTHAPTSPATTHAATTTTHHTTSTKKTTAESSPTKVTTKKLFSSSSKKGLAWSGTNAQIPHFVNNDVVVIYNWGANPPVADGLIGCSMLWGNKNLAAFRQYRDKYDCIMGMNEVNLGSQSGLSVGSAVALWNDEVRPLGLQGKTLICPSVTTASDGIPYLQSFFKQCKEKNDGQENCGCSALSAHVYDTSVDKVKSYLTTLHSTFNMPIYMSELACMTFYDEAGCSNPEAFMTEIMQFCQETSWMMLCSPYGFAPSYGGDVSLISGSGEPTSLGQAFLNA
jgi:hypothetical protein